MRSIPSSLAVLSLLLLPGCAYKAALPAAALSGSRPAASDRKLEREAWLELRVKRESDVGITIGRVRSLADDWGGYVVAERTDGIELKVPGDRFQEAIMALSGFGHLAEKRTNAVDVTADFQDLQIRLENARTEQAKLKDLYARAQDVDDMLKVEKELARVTADLEALEGRMRLMENQTGFADINVSVSKRVWPGPVGWVFYGLYTGVKWLLVWD